MQLNCIRIMIQQAKHDLVDGQTNPRRLLAEELVSRGFRMTHQRKLLVDLIQKADRHLDAVDLWHRARVFDSTINKVTVYRTLSLLKRQGLVDELDLMHMNGEKHYYEARTNRDHLHLACLQCGAIMEFESPLFEKLKSQIKKEQRFTIQVVRMEVGGVCASCRNKK